MNKNPNFVFFGTPEFASLILEKLIAAGMPPSALVCNPDRPVGRKKVITPPPTKVVAEAHGIRVFQPDAVLSAGPMIDKKTDFFVIAAYSQIIPKEVLQIPRLGAVGVHPSLLPKYRGAAPIQSAILGGDKETGVTLYLVDEKMDHGPVLAQKAIPVGASDYSALLPRLASLGGEMLLETLPKFLKGELHPAPQRNSEATYTKKFSTEDGFMPPGELKLALEGKDFGRAVMIERMVRALNPEPGVWTKNLPPYGEKRVKILEVAFDGRKISLKKIQEEGKNPISL